MRLLMDFSGKSEKKTKREEQDPRSFSSKTLRTRKENNPSYDPFNQYEQYDQFNKYHPVEQYDQFYDHGKFGKSCKHRDLEKDDDDSTTWDMSLSNRTPGLLRVRSCGSESCSSYSSSSGSESVSYSHSSNSSKRVRNVLSREDFSSSSSSSLALDDDDDGSSGDAAERRELQAELFRVLRRDPKARERIMSRKSAISTISTISGPSKSENEADDLWWWYEVYDFIYNLLLQKREIVNAVDSYGHSPLQVLCSNPSLASSISLIKLFVETSNQIWFESVAAVASTTSSMVSSTSSNNIVSLENSHHNKLDCKSPSNMTTNSVSGSSNNVGSNGDSGSNASPTEKDSSRKNGRTADRFIQDNSVSSGFHNDCDIDNSNSKSASYSNNNSICTVPIVNLNRYVSSDSLLGKSHRSNRYSRHRHRRHQHHHLRTKAVTSQHGKKVQSSRRSEYGKKRIPRSQRSKLLLALKENQWSFWPNLVQFLFSKSTKKKYFKKAGSFQRGVLFGGHSRKDRAREKLGMSWPWSLFVFPFVLYNNSVRRARIKKIAAVIARNRHHSMTSLTLDNKSADVMADHVSSTASPVPAEAVRQRSFSGATALHRLCKNAANTTPDVVEYLVQCNPSAVCVKDALYRNLPIHEVCIAATVKYVPVEILLILLQQWPQSCLNKNVDGNVPLHLAVQIKDARRRDVEVDEDIHSRLLSEMEDYSSFGVVDANDDHHLQDESSTTSNWNEDESEGDSMNALYELPTPQPQNLSSSQQHNQLQQDGQSVEPPAHHKSARRHSLPHQWHSSQQQPVRATVLTPQNVRPRSILTLKSNNNRQPKSNTRTKSEAYLDISDKNRSNTSTSSRDSHRKNSIDCVAPSLPPPPLASNFINKTNPDNKNKLTKLERSHSISNTNVSGIEKKKVATGQFSKEDKDGKNGYPVRTKSLTTFNNSTTQKDQSNLQETSQLEMVQFLVDYCPSSLYIKNNHGHTPLQAAVVSMVACGLSHHPIVDALREYMSKFGTPLTSSIKTESTTSTSASTLTSSTISSLSSSSSSYARLMDYDDEVDDNDDKDEENVNETNNESDNENFNFNDKSLPSRRERPIATETFDTFYHHDEDDDEFTKKYFVLRQLPSTTPPMILLLESSSLEQSAHMCNNDDDCKEMDPNTSKENDAKEKIKFNRNSLRNNDTDVFQNCFSMNALHCRDDSTRDVDDMDSDNESHAILVFGNASINENERMEFVN